VISWKRSALHDTRYDIWHQQQFSAVVAWEKPVSVVPEIVSYHDPAGCDEEVSGIDHLMLGDELR
jgi:hypothetical protein